jgi:hypothetical protein
MNKMRAIMIGFYILGAILLLAPVPATAGPVLPGEPIGTHVNCGKAVTVGSKLASAQPLRVHGICQEILSIADTRVNITVIGDGDNVIPLPTNAPVGADHGGKACDANDGSTTIIPSDPSAAEIIQVRGKNITITALNVFGLRADDPSIKPPIAPFPKTQWDKTQCAGSTPKAPQSVVPDSESLGCSNNRGIRAQRNGIMQIGRNTRDDAIQGGENPQIYVEKTGVCIKYVGSQGIEVTQGSFARVINSEVQHVGGDAILISEGSAAFIGSTSGSEYKLVSDAFAGPGHSGPNYIHNNTGAGINVDRGSEARIVNNYIAFNGKAGIAVARASQADVDSNRIDGNLANGLTVGDNSNVSLGTTFDTLGCNATTWGAPCGTPGSFDPRTLANTVTVANTSFGIKCTIGGSISGRATTDRGGGSLSLFNGGNTGSAAKSTFGTAAYTGGTVATGDNCINKTT